VAKDNRVLFLNLATGEKCRAFVWTNNEDMKQDIRRLGNLAFSPDGETLAGCVGGTRIWNAASGKEVCRMEADGCLTYSADGRILAVGGGGYVGFFEVAIGKEQRRIRIQAKWSDYHLAWSPDGKLLATGHNNGTIRLWDAATGEERGQFRGHRGEIITLAFSPDGKRLLSASKDRTALVWDVRQGLRAKRD
jgi:WD40 repeat protein